MPEQQTIVITGASDGIGAEAARQLSAHGHRVVVVGRSPEKAAAVAAELDAPFHLADFADLTQVRTLATELLTAYPRIDVLANNAGGIFTRQSTGDGFDKTFQVNHLAPFLLTHLLLDRLIESGTKVIQTSSVGIAPSAGSTWTTWTTRGSGRQTRPTATPSWPTCCSPRSCTGATTTGA